MLESLGQSRLLYWAYSLTLTVLCLAIIFLATLIAWRVWTFTIKPALYPSRPKELPYWVPWLGHALEYINNGQQLLTRAREYFGNTREPFGLTLGGQKIYFLTNATDVKALFKNSTTFTFDTVVKDLTIVFGVSERYANLAYSQLDSERLKTLAVSLGTTSTQRKNLAHLNGDLWKHQLLEGTPEYHKIQYSFFHLLHRALGPGEMAAWYNAGKAKQSAGNRKVQLLHLTQQVLIKATLEVFLGKVILENWPEIVSLFLAFDEDNWMLWYHYPNATKMHSAKNRIKDILYAYIQLPVKRRADAAYIVKKMEATQKALGFPDEETATILIMVIFVTNTNTWKLCFWVMAYILSNRTLYQTVREETRSCFQSSVGELDPIILEKACPQLEGVVCESLRLCSASSSIRLINSEKAILGGKEFKYGERIVAPFRQLHTNEDVYGSPADLFDHTRFLTKNKSLAEHYKPFGGGVSYCPGRFIAKQEVKAFVVFLLHQWQSVQVDGDVAFPRMDSFKPTTGLMCPIAEEAEQFIITLKN